MGQADRAFFLGRLLDRAHRILHKRLQRHRLIGGAVDERGVGAVLKQPSHQVSQQGFMRADRRVNAAGAPEFPPGDRPDHLLIQRLTHSVQALKLVLPGLISRASQHVNSGERACVVCRELRIYLLGCSQEFSRAGHVGHVGVGLAGVDGIARLCVDLHALDFAVPVRAFDESDHQPSLAAPGQIDEPVDERRAALLVSLDHKADAVPASERWLEAQALQQIERKFKAIGFFGIDIQADVVAPG